MEKKRALLGVQKKKKLIRRNNNNNNQKKKKKLLRNVLRYLKSDSYMYAPLLSTPPKRLTRSDPSGKEFTEPSKRDAKRLLERVADYLKSDSYLYAPLIPPKITSSPATGPSEYLKRITKGELSGRSAKKDNHSSNQSVHITAEDRSSKGYLVETRIASQRILGRRERVKHMVYQSCHLSSVPGI